MFKTFVACGRLFSLDALDMAFAARFAPSTRPHDMEYRESDSASMAGTLETPEVMLQENRPSSERSKDDDEDWRDCERHVSQPRFLRSGEKS